MRSVRICFSSAGMDRWSGDTPLPPYLLLPSKHIHLSDSTVQRDLNLHAFSFSFSGEATGRGRATPPHEGPGIPPCLRSTPEPLMFEFPGSYILTYPSLPRIINVGCILHGACNSCCSAQAVHEKPIAIVDVYIFCVRLSRFVAQGYEAGWFLRAACMHAMSIIHCRDQKR